MEKKPVTIYLPRSLHVALKHAAADQGISMSDLVSAAVEALLHGGTVGPTAARSTQASPVHDEFARDMTRVLAPVMDALTEQTAIIRRIGGMVDSKADGEGSDTVTPQAGRVAAAATGILDHLARAGDMGMRFGDLRSAVGNGVSTASMQAAIAAFREAGVIIRKGNSWVLAHR